MEQPQNQTQIANFTLPELIAMAGGDKDQWLIGECITADSASRMQEFRFPSRIDALIIGVGTEGESITSFNLQQCNLRKDTMFIYTPNNIVQRHTDNHFRAHVLAISPKLLNSLNIVTKQMMPLFMQFGANHCVELSPEKSQTLRSFITQIENEVSGPRSTFTQEIVAGLITATIYKVGDILKQHIDEHPEQQQPAGSRAEIYFRELMEILSKHYKRERSVSFYARQLCVTPKYLTTLIKQVSGRSVSEWVDSYVILEAKTLLKYSNMSVQEVAYHLNFPNQSFFGCYFKRSTGMSPSQYKAQS